MQSALTADKQGIQHCSRSAQRGSPYFLTSDLVSILPFQTAILEDKIIKFNPRNSRLIGHLESVPHLSYYDSCSYIQWFKVLNVASYTNFRNSSILYIFVVATYKYYYYTSKTLYFYVKIFTNIFQIADYARN